MKKTRTSNKTHNLEKLFLCHIEHYFMQKLFLCHIEHYFMQELFADCFHYFYFHFMHIIFIKGVFLIRFLNL